MIFHRLGLITKNQKGFTLIEVLIAMVITAFITGAIAVAISQVFTGNARTSSHMTAVRQVQNTGYWISQDAQMAQNIVTEDNPDTAKLELVALTWTEYGADGDEHQVVYSLEDNELSREHYTNREPDSLPDTTTAVARHIDSITRQFVDGKLSLTVTAYVDGWKPASETRTYEVIPRPSSY